MNFSGYHPVILTRINVLMYSYTKTIRKKGTSPHVKPHIINARSENLINRPPLHDDVINKRSLFHFKREIYHFDFCPLFFGTSWITLLNAICFFIRCCIMLYWGWFLNRSLNIRRVNFKNNWSWTWTPHPARRNTNGQAGYSKGRNFRKVNARKENFFSNFSYSSHL